MFAYGEPEITDGSGIVRNWRNDLARKLLSIQNKEGFWLIPYKMVGKR